MLSTQEETYLKGIILNYYDNGYKYYLCETNNPNNAYNQSYNDIICFFSKEKMEKTDSSYTILNAKKCEIDTKGPTSTNKQNSLRCSNYNGIYNLNLKEFVYSNSPYESNLISSYETNTFYLITIVISITMIFLYYWISKLLKNRRDINE